MNIVSAKYVHDRLSEKNCSINAVIQITDSRTTTVHVPLPKTEEENKNRHYRAIQEWVKAGNTIADAD
tara:strand:+ start:13826 stop:14029 length:204 start_codon:yes stop_codon:yes gene_type:complete